MIPFDFDYYRPDTIREAVETYSELSKAGRKPYYYGGGTEILSMARVSDLQPDAVIDIKSIPECTEHGTNGGRLHFGAGLTLSAIVQANLFPLLTKACGRVADHTIQGKVTLGGNVCGTIIYRESLLPLLLAEATLTTASPEGMKDYLLKERLNNGMRLGDGELLVKITLDKAWAERRYWHIKKVAAEKIGYPLLTVCALEDGGRIKTAFSGLCAFPSMPGYGWETKPEELAGRLPGPILSNVEGSAKYREYVLRNTLESITKQAGG